MHKEDKRKTAAHRLAIVEGHLRKVRKMLDEGAYCIHVIHQSRAIQQALRKFDEQVLERHLKTCVARNMKSGNIEATSKELLEVFERL